MSNIQKDILKEFYAELSEKEEINGEILTKLKAVLSTGKKPKVDDLVKIFSEPEAEIQ